MSLLCYTDNSYIVIERTFLSQVAVHWVS